MSKPKGEGAHWLKSSLSLANGACVEATASGGIVGVRDTKQENVAGGGPVMEFTKDEWESFLDQLNADPVKTANLVAGKTAVAFALSSGRTLAQVPNEAGGVEWGKSDSPDVIHTFSAGEITPGNVSEIGAFVVGALGGEFGYERISQEEVQLV